MNKSFYLSQNEALTYGKLKILKLLQCDFVKFLFKKAHQVS